MAQRNAHSTSRPLARLTQPFQQFVGTESAGGIVLLAAVVLAILLANSPWSAGYARLLDTPLVVSAGPYRIEESARGWVNDGGMVLFFFFVGIEIKRELAVGELNSIRRAVVPSAAALGGMFVAGLAYPHAATLEQAKLGILAASICSGVLGYALLRGFARSPGGVEAAN